MPPSGSGLVRMISLQISPRVDTLDRLYNEIRSRGTRWGPDMVCLGATEPRGARRGMAPSRQAGIYAMRMHRGQHYAQGVQFPGSFHGTDSRQVPVPALRQPGTTRNSPCRMFGGYLAVQRGSAVQGMSRRRAFASAHEGMEAQLLLTPRIIQLYRRCLIIRIAIPACSRRF